MIFEDAAEKTMILLCKQYILHIYKHVYSEHPIGVLGSQLCFANYVSMQEKNNRMQYTYGRALL